MMLELPLFYYFIIHTVLFFMYTQNDLHSNYLK